MATAAVVVGINLVKNGGAGGGDRAHLDDNPDFRGKTKHARTKRQQGLHWTKGTSCVPSPSYMSINSHVHIPKESRTRWAKLGLRLSC